MTKLKPLPEDRGFILISYILCTDFAQALKNGFVKPFVRGMKMQMRGLEPLYIVAFLKLISF